VEAGELRKKVLLKALNDPEDAVRQAASQALEKIEASWSLSHITALLKEGNRGQQVKALIALERIDSLQIFPLLLTALKNPDADIRAAAVQVLGHKAHPKTLGNLVKYLKDPHPAVRVHCADALGNFADARLVPLLGACLQDADDALVVSAARSLGKIGSPQAEEALAAAATDPRAAVRAAALLALAELKTA